MAKSGVGLHCLWWISLCGFSVFAQVNNIQENLPSSIPINPDGNLGGSSPSPRGVSQSTTTLLPAKSSTKSSQTLPTSPPEESKGTDLTTDGHITRPAAPYQVGQFDLRRESDGPVCIKAIFAMVFKVYYTSKKEGELEATIILPIKATVEGRCGDDGEEETFTLQWEKDKYSLKMIFGTDYSLKQYPQWEVRKFQFTYNSNDKVNFYDPVNPGEHTVYTDRKRVYLKTLLGNSRKCLSEDDIILKGDRGEKVILEIKDLLLQPYDVYNNTFSAPMICNADLLKKNNVASVVVGLTIAITIILVITGYAVGRKIGIIAEKPRYNSME